MSDQSMADRPYFQPITPTPLAINTLVRITERVVVTATGCWEWTGTRNKLGYGLISYRGKQKRVHRLVYDLCVATIPEGMNVCHDCPAGDNPICCNPSHLFLGTQQDNIHDCMSKRRFKSRPPACGEINPNAKLTEEIVREIRARHRAGALQVDLLAEYGISRASMHRIVSGKAWGHIFDWAEGFVEGGLGI